MTSTWNHLPGEVAAKLRAFHRRRRLFRILRVQFATLSVYGVLLLLATHIDRFFFLEAVHRAALFWGVHAIAVALWAVLMASLLFRKSDTRSVAYAFEGALDQDVEECFVTLDSVLAQRTHEQGQAAADFLRDLTGKTILQSKPIKPKELVRDRRLRMLIVACGMIAVFFAALCVPHGYEFPLMLQRFYNPHAPLPKASFTKLAVRFGKGFVGQGNEVVIEAEITGEMPMALRWLLSLINGPTSGCVISSTEAEISDLPFQAGKKTDMNRIDRRLFVLYRNNVEKTFSFRVRSGDAQTLTHTIHVVHQPVIHHTALTATPPRYVGSNDVIVENPHLTSGRRLAFLPGTQIKLVYSVDKPVVQTQVLVDEEPQPFQWDAKALTGRFETEVRREARLEITATDKHGFSNVMPARIDIATIEDQPPVVKLSSPPTQIQKVFGEIVSFNADIEDDYGIEKAFLRFMRNPDEDREDVEPREIPLEVRKTENVYGVSVLFDLGETGAMPGDVVVAQIRARDVAGNDGFSAEVHIDVVPFTRDENERQRLAALAVVHECLKLLADVYSKEQPQVPAEAPEHIKKLVQAENVSTFSGLSAESLSRMLEMENHFTDRHRHKEDIRRLEGVISCALHPFSVRDDSPAFRSKTLGTLAADIIPGLTALRRAKNITWRLFGMQREARRIEEQIAGMQKQKASPAELQAMGRRTALYLETLQSIGSDLLRLARETKAVSADEIDKRVGEVNIAGYYLSRGQQPSQGNSIERIKQQIAELLALTTGTFGAFVKEETEARAKLNQLYDSILASTAAAGGSPGARKWLAKDASSMQLDPFHAHWPIFLRLALMGEPGAVPASTLLDPAAPLHEAIANEQRTADELAFQWEINHVISNDAAPVEKAVELAVISSEKQKTFGMLIGDKPSTVIPIPDPAVSVSEADFAQFVGRLASSEGTNAKTAILKYRDAIKTQAAAAEKQINGLFEHALRELTSASASMEKAIASVAEAAAGGQEQLRERVQNVCALAQAERDLLASVAALGYARLCFLYDDAQAPQTEKLMLRMRELQQRYQSRLEPVLASITKAALNPQGTSGVAAVQNDVQQLQVLHDAVQSRLEALIAAYGGEGIPDEDNGRQYMLLADFRRTAELLSEAKAAVDAHLTADAVAAFLERFPEAGVYNILAHASSLQLLHESLGEMQTCLKAQTVSMRALTDSWNAAMRNLASLVAVVEQSGPGEYQQRISGRLQQLSGRLERVKPQAQEGDRLDPAQTTRLLYDIEQIMANLGGLQRELRFIAETLQDDRTAAKGGPPGIWEPELQRSAEFAQKRTLALAGEAQRRVFTAILDELNANSSDTAAEAYAWAVLLHRMVRSELYGVGVIRSPRAEAVEAADPHLAFLEEEIRNALQAADVKYYSRIVEEYLKSLRDFLRY